MPLTNLNSAHLTQAQVTDAQDALTQLETALAAVNVNLTPEERQQYGSINEQNKLMVNKVNDYHRDSPNLSVSDVDWTEFDKDFASRGIFENLITRLDALTNKLKNAKTLHDFDNYQAALADYAYTSYRAGTGAEGFETKYNELKQFFNRTGKTNKTTPPVTE
jgi:hypothetical protein